MTPTQYQEVAPRPDLASFIHCVWTFDAQCEIADQPIIPDGRCELIVHCAEPYSEIDAVSGTWVKQLPILFAGQVTCPLTLRANGPIAVLGVRFTPTGAWPFLGKSLSSFTDHRVDLRTIAGPDASRFADALKSAGC
jgi:hypothetical protein